MPGCLERRTTSRGFVLAGAYFAMIMFAGGAPSDEIKECIYRSGTWTLINRPVGCAVTYCSRTKRSSNPWLNWVLVRTGLQPSPFIARSRTRPMSPQERRPPERRLDSRRRHRRIGTSAHPECRFHDGRQPRTIPPRRQRQRRRSTSDALPFMLRWQRCCVRLISNEILLRLRLY
jgi:hypothetical protein